MNQFLQQLVDGVAWGALYGALALSLVLVYRASGIVNFAQGEMAMISAFFGWQFYMWGLPIIPAIGAAMLLAFVGGALVERVLIRPLAATANHLTLIIVTLGLMIILNAAAGSIWDYTAKEFPTVWEGSPIHLGPAVISRQSLAIIVVVTIMSGALYWLLQRTKAGLCIRASANNPESARLLGIPVNRSVTMSWGLAAAVGALAAMLAAPLLYLQPNMLAATLLYSFAAAMLGGLDSPVGALVGGLIVGVTENLAGAYVPGIGNDFKQAVALVIIIGVLLFKSEGLFGSKKVVRV